MAREDNVIGLDIGTTKVCAVIGQGDANGRLTISGVGLVPSRGLKKGVVIDVEETILAVREAIDRARHMAGIDVRLAVAGVTGDHIKSSNLRGTVTIGPRDRTITVDDVERVLQAAAMDVPKDREIIHSLPRYFAVDGQRGVRRPIGMSGSRLEVESHVVTGQASFLHNVVRCIEGADLKMEALVLEPIATAEAVATSDERELGVMLIDIGGGTSDIAVFQEGSIVFSAVLPVGGNHVTRDISIGLRTPLETAERLKIERGVASISMIPHGEALEVVTAGSGERLRLPRQILGEIIEARMRELFEMAYDAVQESGVHRRLPAGVILSGGGALLPGAIDLAGEVFQMPVRMGRPIELSGWSDQVETPQFSTAVGLLRFALRQRSSRIGQTAGMNSVQLMPAAEATEAPVAVPAPLLPPPVSPTPPTISPAPNNGPVVPAMNVSVPTFREGAPARQAPASTNNNHNPPAPAATPATAPAAVTTEPRPEPRPAPERPPVPPRQPVARPAATAHQPAIFEPANPPEGGWRGIMARVRHFLGFEEE